jgi:hypothetical protein
MGRAYLTGNPRFLNQNSKFQLFHLLTWGVVHPISWLSFVFILRLFEVAKASGFLLLKRSLASAKMGSIFSHLFFKN